jgi:hypothetical protein
MITYTYMHEVCQNVGHERFDGITARPPWFRCLQAAKASPEVAGRFSVQFETEEAGMKPKAWVSLTHSVKVHFRRITSSLQALKLVNTSHSASEEVIKRSQVVSSRSEPPSTAAFRALSRSVLLQIPLLAHR